MRPRRDIYTEQILEYYAQGIGAKHIAALCGCSESHVRQIYRRTGITVAIAPRGHQQRLVEGMKEFLRAPVPWHLRR